MDIRQLNYFVQVADLGNYSKAAQKLFVSQPALSKTIKNMEEEMGFPFFYIHHKRLHLTDAGRSFYDNAMHVLNDFDTLLSFDYKEHGTISGHLNIGLSAAAGPALFAHISPKFSAAYPLIDISLIEKDSGIIKEQVFNRNIDAAFVDMYYLTKEDMSLFDVYEVAESDLVAVMSMENPLSKKDQLSFNDLDGSEIIFFQSDGVSFGLLSDDIKSSKSKIKTVMSSSQWHLIFDLAEADYGITIAPYYIYDKLHSSRLVAVPFNEPSSKRTIALITKKDDNLPRALKVFLEFSSNKEQYKDLIYHLKVSDKTDSI